MSESDFYTCRVKVSWSFRECCGSVRRRFCSILGVTGRDFLVRCCAMRFTPLTICFKGGYSEGEGHSWCNLWQYTRTADKYWAKDPDVPHMPFMISHWA